MNLAARRLRATVVLVAAFATAASLAPAAVGAPAVKKGETLVGTVSWTTTTVIDDDVPGGDKSTGTSTTKVTMKVKMTRRGEAYYFQMEDNGSSYAGTATLASTDLERDFDGNVNCTVTHSMTGSGSGPLPKKPTDTKAPSMFSTIVPGTAALGSKTKAIILKPILRYTGTDTTTYAGSGISPCAGGQYVDPVEGSLSPNSSANDICYPKGTNSKNAPTVAGDIVGAWNNSKKAFVFNCTKTIPGDGATVTTTISGVLKVK